MNNNSNGLWSQSLLLSVLAGASTCLGAAVVLVRKAPLRKAHLAAALSLAGSVMMTVSIFSLLPEALEHVEASWAERIGSFVVGSVLYYLLSKCAFPEPEDILGFEEENKNNSQTQQTDVVPLVTTSTPTTPSKQRSLRIRSQASSKDEEATLSPQVSSVDLDTSESKFSNSTSASSSWWAQFTADNNSMSTDARRAWRVTLLMFVSLTVHNFPEGLAVSASTMHSPQLGVTTGEWPLV